MHTHWLLMLIFKPVHKVPCIHKFLKSFFINAFTAADVLSEDTVLKWYKGGHAAKGKSVFLEQMKKMVEWLQSAEEGKYTFQ